MGNQTEESEEFQGRIRQIAEWPAIRERLEESISIIKRGNEPYFFTVENGTGHEISPVYEGGKVSNAPLDDLLRYLQKSGAASLTAIAHFHPDNVLEPSKSDLMAANTFYGPCRNYGTGTPLFIIGRGNSQLDMLVINQTGRLDLSHLDSIGLTVEKHLNEQAFPRYLEEQNVSGEIVQNFRMFISQISHLRPTRFFHEMTRYLIRLPCKTELEAFIRDFQSDFTIFPEYVGSVVKTLQEMGCYQLGVMSYDDKTREFAPYGII